MTSSALSFKNIQKSYDKKPILKSLNLDIQKGEFFGLVGMNGAGKTTLLKCLLDFCALDEGVIEIFGTSNQLTHARKTIAFLPERFMPPYYLSGKDFLNYMLQLQDISYNQSLAESTLAALDFDHTALKKSVRLYSKGMTQKLGLAACFLAQKDLYIFDEPMSGLDPKARAMLKTRLLKLRDNGGTLFFSSHALADVEEICDRMAILHEGTFRFIGTPKACREQFNAETLELAYMNCIST